MSVQTALSSVFNKLFETTFLNIDARIITVLIMTSHGHSVLCERVMRLSVTRRRRLSKLRFY